MPAWNGWYHLMTNTFGTWLPGDARGFRTRDHREHVEGDYKSPPPTGMFEKRHAKAMTLLKREAVALKPRAREAAVRAIVHALVTVHELDVLSLCVGGVHLHLLVRLPASLRQKPTPSKRGLRGSSVDDPARHYLGIAKKESAKILAGERFVEPGGVWAKRGKVVPIANRAHQLCTFRYILDHVDEGAAVWSFKEADVVRMKKPTD